MRAYFNELVLWFFLVAGALLVITSTQKFLKVLVPKLPVPNGLKEAFAA